MIKVLKTPLDCDFLFSPSLSAREVTRVLTQDGSSANSSSSRAARRRRRPGRTGNRSQTSQQQQQQEQANDAQSTSNDDVFSTSTTSSTTAIAPTTATAPVDRPGTVAPKPNEEADECPICFEGIFGMPAHELTWCALGCGKQLCLACMVQCFNHKKNEGRKPTCPLCRSAWLDKIEPMGPPPSAKKQAALKRAEEKAKPKPQPNMMCSECKLSIHTKQYRCLQCRWYFLCERCFNKGRHRHGREPETEWHKFVWRPNYQQQEWIATQRQRQPLQRQFIADLQNRELGPDDYAMLRRLDEPQIVSMQAHLTAALKNPNSLLMGITAFLQATKSVLTETQEKENALANGESEMTSDVDNDDEEEEEEEKEVDPDRTAAANPNENTVATTWICKTLGSHWKTRIASCLSDVTTLWLEYRRVLETQLDPTTIPIPRALWTPSRHCLFPTNMRCTARLILLIMTKANKHLFSDGLFGHLVGGEQERRALLRGDHQQDKEATDTLENNRPNTTTTTTTSSSSSSSSTTTTTTTSTTSTTKKKTKKKKKKPKADPNDEPYAASTADKDGYKAGRYTGELSDGKLREGAGRLEWPNGDFYEGGFKDGLRW